MSKKYYAGVLKKIILIIVVSLFMTAWIDPLKDEVEKGNRNYQEGNFDSALEHYNESEKYASGTDKQAILNFNKGAAEYKRGNFEKGIELFNQSLNSGDPDIRKKSYLNMGNSYVELKQYDEAFKAYSMALGIDPSYERAKKNIEYLLHKDEMKQKNKNENSRDNGEDKKDKNKDNNKEKNKEEKDKNSDDDSGDNEESQTMKRNNISKEQMKSILESLKNKPLRRQRGGKGDYIEPDKAW